MYQTERLRALRRDTYRCQRRIGRRPCLRRTAQVGLVDGQYLTDCGRHDSVAGG